MIVIANLETLAVLLAVFVGGGMLVTVALQLVRGRQCTAIAEIYETPKGGVPIQVGRKSIDGSDDVFSWGEHQYAYAKEYIVRYTKWNHWGGRMPTYRFEQVAAKPGSEATADVSELAQKGEKAFVDPHPSSATVNLIFRRGGLKTMINATKSTTMDPRIAGVAGAVIAGGIIFVLMSYLHPGLVAAAPAGYHYILQQNPTNVTTVVTQP